MEFFVSIDADNAGARVGLASLANNIEELRRVSNSIIDGNKIWTDWALNNRGEVIGAAGDECRLLVPASCLSQIPKIAKKYTDFCGFTVTIGVGKQISEADKALLVGKIRGKNCVVMFDEHVEAEFQLLAKQKETISEQEKLGAEYFAKYVAPDQAGRMATGRPAEPITESENLDDTGQALSSIINAKRQQPPPAEATPAAKDFERLFHGHAQLQEQNDQAPIHAKNDQLDSLRGEIAQVLETVREQVPVLDELQQVAPETYEAVMGLTQAVIDLARELKNQGVVQSESLMKALETVMPLPKPKVKKRPQLPVGTALNGKVKVRHPDGRTFWANVKDGQILSGEGNPISARYPDPQPKVK